MPRAPKYPWDQWFSEGKWTLEHGEDGLPDEGPQVMTSMRSQIHNEAKYRGVKVKTRLTGDPYDGSAKLEVTVLGPGDPRRRHEWGVLFNGDRHILQRGVDFDGTMEDFLAKARSAAYRADKTLSFKVIGDKVGFVAKPLGSNTLEAWADRLEPGKIYKGRDLIDSASSWRGMTVSAQHVAVALRARGGQRRRGGAGSSWLIPATLESEPPQAGDDSTGG